jgi:hypothetical protein
VCLYKFNKVKLFALEFSVLDYFRFSLMFLKSVKNFFGKISDSCKIYASYYGLWRYPSLKACFPTGKQNGSNRKFECEHLKIALSCLFFPTSHKKHFFAKFSFIVRKLVLTKIGEICNNCKSFFGSGSRIA